MFLAALLTDAGYPPDSVHTDASVHLGAGPTITKIVLDCEVLASGVDYAQFQELAAQAKAACPVSKALAAVPEIVLNARLLG